MTSVVADFYKSACEAGQASKKCPAQKVCPEQKPCPAPKESSSFKIGPAPDCSGYVRIIYFLTKLTTFV